MPLLGSRVGTSSTLGEKKPTPPVQTDSGQLSQHSGDIQQDPKAMQLVDELKQMGYSSDDVAQAMGGDGDESSDTAISPGDSAAKAAPLQIPGM